MFEKEAEEYQIANYDYGKTDGIADAFQDGAEFGYNKAKAEMQEQGLALQSDMDKTIEQNIQLKKQNNWLEGCKLELAEHLGKANDKISELEQQIEKMKKYIKACWVKENINDYSSYITNTSDEFRDLVKELNNEVRNGR